MRSPTSSQNKRLVKSRNSNGSRRSNSAGLSSAMDSVIATVSAGEELKVTINNFARAIDELTHGDASDSVVQVQQTIDSAVVTAMHAKETYDLAKAAFDSVKGTAKEVFEKVKEKPEPFIAATVPVAIGLYMMLRRTQSARTGGSRQRRNSTRALHRSDS